jgi:hypothetical protein
MLPGNRRKRAILRDRRQGWHGITPLIGPLDRRDLFLISQYYAQANLGMVTTLLINPDAERVIRQTQEAITRAVNNARRAG